MENPSCLAKNLGLNLFSPNLFLVLGTILLLNISGYRTLASLDGKSTENLRIWDRHDTQNNSLLVFIHGFNSTNDEAWGQFPSLVLKDADFQTHNILRLGYPTKLCGQISDIRAQGDYIASNLIDILPKYSEVLLVGHSMGGLVTLHSLLALEQSSPSSLENLKIKVMTFGTPYVGVKRAELLSYFPCENQQAKGMQVLDRELHRLKEDYTSRFGLNSKIHIPIYAYYGIEDNFVVQGSACGGPVKGCESVDGDHISMVKPTSRDHLSYIKLRGILERKTIPQVSEGKVGIFVARIAGDDNSFRGQNNLIHNLENEIFREPRLRSLIEIHGLPFEIPGGTIDAQEKKAQELGRQYNASIIVWGHLDGIFKKDTFHPRVSLVGSKFLQNEFSVLPPIREETGVANAIVQRPRTSRLPPQPIKEVVQLARYIVGQVFIEKRNWKMANDQFENLLEDKSANSLMKSLSNFHLGYVGLLSYNLTGNFHLLSRSREFFQKALDGSPSPNGPDFQIRLRANLGIVYGLFAKLGIKSIDYCVLGAQELEEAIRLEKANPENDSVSLVRMYIALAEIYRLLGEFGETPAESYAHAKSNIQNAILLIEKNEENFQKQDGELVDVSSYFYLAALGVEPEQNLTLALKLLNKKTLEVDVDNWGELAKIQNASGKIHYALAGVRANPQGDLENAKKEFFKAIESAGKSGNENCHAEGIVWFGMSLFQLANKGLNPRENYHSALEKFNDAASCLTSIDALGTLAKIYYYQGIAYKALGELKVQPNKNFLNSVDALWGAVALWTVQKNYRNLGFAKYELANTYSLNKNFEMSLKNFTDVNELFSSPKNPIKGIHEEIVNGQILQNLAMRGINFKSNLDLAIEIFKEVIGRCEILRKYDSLAFAHGYLGKAYFDLGKRNRSSGDYFKKAVKEFQEAIQLAEKYKDFRIIKWARHYKNLAKKHLK